MVSVERLKSMESYPDQFSQLHHLRSFPSRLLYSNSSSLFDYADVLMKKDMELGSTLLGSVFPSLYDGIRQGRHCSYDAASPHSEFKRRDLHPTSDIKVIPIKVEYGPDRYQGPNNIKYRLLNGSPKKTEDRREDSSPCFSHNVPELFSAPSPDLSASVNLNSPKDYKPGFSTGTLKADQRTVSPRAVTLKSLESNEVDSFSYFDSRQNLQKYRAENDFNERKADMWKPIPVHHFDSSPVSKSPEKSNSNNNSSGHKYSSMSSKSSPIEAHSSQKEDTDFSSLNCSKQSSNPSMASTPLSPNVSELEIEENLINYPPSYPIYDVLKVKLALESRTIDYIKGDGNCFFRALSKGLYGSEQYHRTLRNFIVDIITTNKSKFAPFVDMEDVQEHVKKMSEDHYWATTCEIYAAATLLQRDIFMLTPDHLNENYSWLLFKPVFKTEVSSDIPSHNCYISLCNTNGNHYDRVVPDHGGCNCFLPFPQLGKVV